MNTPASIRRLRLCRLTKLYFLTLTSQHTRISPRSSCDVMVAGTSLPASGDRCLTTGPASLLVSISPLPLAEAPEIPMSCLEQTAARCKQCYLEYKASPYGYSETRTERCCLRVSLYSAITSSFFMSSRKKECVCVFLVRSTFFTDLSFPLGLQAFPGSCCSFLS